MKFDKLQATGNDFILVDARHLERDWPKLAVAVCHRRFGVGGDGLLLLLTSTAAHFGMRMFNPDGSEAEVCGNGLMCFAKYVFDSGLAEGSELLVETAAGIRRVKADLAVGPAGRLQADMGMPRFRPEQIPLSIDDVDIIPVLDYPIEIGGTRLLASFVSMGNPHAVCFMEEPVAGFPLSALGPAVEHHPLFPQRTNFEVVNIRSRSKLVARVWERGAGETLACGSGACAIAVAAQLHGYVDDKVDIMLPGGTLGVRWDGKGEVWLSGVAQLVFTGEWIERG